MTEKRTLTHRQSAVLDGNDWKTVIAPTAGKRLQLFSAHVSKDTNTGATDYEIRWSGGGIILHKNVIGAGGSSDTWYPDSAGGWVEGPVGEGLEARFPSGTASDDMHLTVCTELRS